MRLIDADRLQKQFDEKSTNPNYRVNMHNIKSIISHVPTIEAIPKADYEARLKTEREKIAKDVADKMDYMGSCLNEKNIILGIITGKRETLESLCSTCKSESCVSNGTAISKADYEARLKADMVAMLTDIQLEIKELWDNRYDVWLDNQYYIGKNDTLEEVDELIQQKIDALKVREND